MQTTAELRIQIPKLHQAQAQIKQERKRFNVVCCGRRFGKNILLQDLAIETALRHGQPVGWGAPTYKMLLDDWKMLTNMLSSVTKRRNEQEKQIALISDGVIDFWSLDNPDAMRGRKYARFMVNEAAFVPDMLATWNNVIRSMLIDYRGDAWFAGTPKGQNGYWQLYNMEGTDAEWKHWQMSSYANPHIPKDELDKLRGTMLERSFQQEILAQFLEDGGGIFRHVSSVATLAPINAGLEGHQYVIGADWGRTDDATVFAVVDVGTGECVHLDRMTDTDFAQQRVRLLGLVGRFNHAAVLVETNSIGQPQLEELQRMGLSVQGFITTNASKAQAIDALALAFEQGKIKIVNDQVLVSELMAYQSERLPSGLIRYGAPEGMHDDTVIALALAWWGGIRGRVTIMADPFD